MIEEKEFCKYFNEDFWKAFKMLPGFFGEIEKKDKTRIVNETYLELVNRSYYPSKPIKEIYKNKENGVVRVIPVFGIKDYCVYYYCVKRLEDKIAVNRIENTFGGWSLGGGLRRVENDEVKRRSIEQQMIEEHIALEDGISISEYSFNPQAWSRWFNDFNSKLYMTCQESNYKYAVELDIANFYDSIRLDLLEIWIREITNVDNSDEISILFHFLNYWNRDANCYNKQTVGIPQDALADCSRILANFYLQKYDFFINSHCISYGCRYFRYADDQFIFGQNLSELEKIVTRATKELNLYGLNINQKKVKYRAVKELVKDRSFEQFEIIKEEKIANPKNTQKFIDKCIELYESGENEALKNKGIPLLNKAILCNLHVISKKSREKILTFLLTDSYLIQAKPYQLVKIYWFLEKFGKKETLIDGLLKLGKRVNETSYLYAVLHFCLELHLDCDEIELRINNIEKYMVSK